MPKKYSSRKRSAPKRHTKSAKRAPRPRRYSSHRRHSSSNTGFKNMNYVRQRLCEVWGVTPTPGSVATNFTVPWQQTNNTAPIASNDFATFDQTPRFMQVRRNYDQYSITGVKIEWIPMLSMQQVDVPVTMTRLAAMYQSDDPDSYSTIPVTTDSSIITGPGFKNMNPFRPFKRFISCKNMSRQMNVPWQDLGTYAAALPNTLTDAVTMYRFKHLVQGNAPSQIGSFKVTWYCHMRGQVAP